MWHSRLLCRYLGSKDDNTNAQKSEGVQAEAAASDQAPGTGVPKYTSEDIVTDKNFANEGLAYARDVEVNNGRWAMIGYVLPDSFFTEKPRKNTKKEWQTWFPKLEWVKIASAVSFRFQTWWMAMMSSLSRSMRLFLSYFNLLKLLLFYEGSFFNSILLQDSKAQLVFKSAFA